MFMEVALNAVRKVADPVIEFDRQYNSAGHTPSLQGLARATIRANYTGRGKRQGLTPSPDPVTAYDPVTA